MAPTLRDIRQDQVIRALIRLGGVEIKGRGKGSHRYISINGTRMSVPSGIIGIGVLKNILKRASISEEDFLKAI